MTEFILFGGKGGVGKTTCASATAISIANDGYNTLIISTDPAHSISDIFEEDFGPEPTKIKNHNNLHAIEVDPKHRFNKNYAGTAKALMNEASNFGVDIDTEELSEFDGGVIGSDEAAVIDLFAEYDNSDEWDYVVFDTAPTGHTLRMLKLPELLDSTVGTILNVKSQIDGVRNTVSGLIGKNKENKDEKDLDDVEIEETRNKLERVSDILKNPSRTQFFGVMEPEGLSLHETKRLVEQLNTYDIPVGGVIVNKVLHDIDSSCSLCSSRYQQQQEIISETNEFFNIPILEIKLKEETPTGNKLEEIAEQINVT